VQAKFKLEMILESERNFSISKNYDLIEERKFFDELYVDSGISCNGIEGI
jgi:hypothetical protein